MRTGSGLPEEYDSSLSVSNSHLQLESTSVQKYLEVVPPSQPERFLLGLFCKKGRERWKQENCDDPTFLAAQQHLNELVAKTVHYSIVPLSVYPPARHVGLLDCKKFCFCSNLLCILCTFLLNLFIFLKIV